MNIIKIMEKDPIYSKRIRIYKSESLKVSPVKGIS